MATVITETAKPVSGIAVSSAGVVDENGNIASATDTMPGWSGILLSDCLRNEFHVPVVALGDVQAHALGESTWGAGRSAQAVLLAGIGTGIGGAVCLGGKLLRGVHGLGGHLGHVTSPAAVGLLCSCGRTGHLEPVASGSGIIAQYRAERAASGRPVTGEIDGREISRLAEQGEKDAGRVIQTAGFSLGEALGSLANVTDPATIILSGSVTSAGDLWWEAVRDGYHSSAMDPVAQVPLVRGELGDSAPLIGAAQAFTVVTTTNNPAALWLS